MSGLALFKKRKKYVSHTNPDKKKKPREHRFLNWLSGGKVPDHLARFYDYKLIITILILCCFGLIMLYSSSAYTASLSKDQGYNEYYFVIREGIFMGIGILSMLFISKIDYHLIKGWFIWLFYFITIGMMILTDFTPLGVEINGQKRWLNLVPGVKQLPTYQPSEFVKIAVILIMAFMINRTFKNINMIRVCIFHVILVAIPFTLVAIKNLSAGIIVFAIGAIMYFIAGKWVKIYLLAFVGGLGAYIATYINPNIWVKLHVLKSYQLNRIMIWKDPLSDATGDGYQILQGLYAIGSGGLFGKGLGNSVQKIGFIPESYNDMIFSIIAEELGLFGAVCILLLFAYLIYRCMFIALRANDLFGSMIVLGVMIQVGLQALLNVAVVTNSMPNTGITLPFVSYGGTSATILLMEMGLVLSVGNQILFEKQ